MAQDYPGVTFDLRVTEGQMVRRGQELCVNRLNPEIAFVAASAGRINRIETGPRRRFASLEITTEGDEPVSHDIGAALTDGVALRSLLLKSGDWVAFRSRPFGHIPQPADRPSAIFVTATDSNPCAADQAVILAPQMEAFRQGVAALLHLTDGPVFVCQRPGPPLIPATGRIRVAHFSGPHPSGLAGTHIHRLWPVSANIHVWQINAQDVAAIGHLLATGQVHTTRTLSVAGPGVPNPALVPAPLGANLRDLVSTSATTPTLISGAILAGRRVQFLSRYDLQVTALDANAKPNGGALPARLLARLPRAWTGATMPLEAFERAFPFDILPVPLMRALAVGDVETAARLGCLELLEDDMALLSRLCPSGCDYGALLRSALDTLSEERAT